MRKAYECSNVKFQVSGRPPCESLILVTLAAFFLTVRCTSAQSDGAIPTDKGRPTVSLTLPRAVELAMQNNRRLKLAHLAVADSEVKRTIARSNYYPHISNQSTALYLTELEGVVIPAGAFGTS